MVHYLAVLFHIDLLYCSHSYIRTHIYTCTHTHTHTHTHIHRLTGISPFFADNLHKTADKIRDAKYSLDEIVFEQISPEAKDFIQSLLQKSPEYDMMFNTSLYIFYLVLFSHPYHIQKSL